MTTVEPRVLQLAALDAPESLHSRILLAVHEARLRRSRNQFAFTFLGTIIGIAYGITWAQSLWTEIFTSSFLENVRFIFTDFDIVRQNIGSFLASLAETFPLTPVLLTLTIGLLACLTLASAGAWKKNRHILHTLAF